MRLLLPVLLVAATAAAAPSAHALEVVAREGDRGRAVTLQRGDTLRLSLEENGTTGYSWRTVRRPARSVLRQRSNRFVAPAETSPPTTGAPGRREVVWRATGTGRTRLALRLVGPGGDSGGTFRLTVTVVRRG